jgi:hypothetical protein
MTLTGIRISWLKLISRASPVPPAAARDCHSRAGPQGTTPANAPSEAVTGIGSVLLLVWLVIGAIADGQRHYYSGSDPT